MNMRQMACCGIREMNGIAFGKPEQIVWDVLFNPFQMANHRGTLQEFRFNTRTGAFLFTQAGAKHKYGEALKAYIEAEKLGTVETVAPFKNFNTGRKIY